ncbi:GNAT family N-acetyltransferase [Flavobacterium pallidum]|uniref:N-acetyltransferase n=1 Tax=Flavobacterium pallidum TaxID=2172098 RepID=A0A2S1SG55_9FLAO|nr:GNAT family N-acetyltransferase [Flavobacterium pallidum]AWI25388.1 N-acetyltransferase [Flavobacterium pallidum]
MDDFSLNEEKKRFELKAEGHTAFIEYILTNDNTMFLTHTEVPTALEGKGVGSRIVEKALQYIADHDYKLAPLCPFVAKYLTRHTDWKSLLAPGYNV